MVQFWSALASRDTRLMTHVLRTHFPTHFRNATWATYLRCHDDVGWAVTDEDAAALGISGPAHRAFLADFYEGVFPGSFARGGLFQSNPSTGDKRSSGTTASFCGLEEGPLAGDAAAGIERAIHRILMGHALIAAFGGVPLVYMGDEIGLANDYGISPTPTRRMTADGCTARGWIGRRPRGVPIPASVEARLFAGMRRYHAAAEGNPASPRRQPDRNPRQRRRRRLRLPPRKPARRAPRPLQLRRRLARGAAGLGRRRRASTDFVDRLTGDAVVPTAAA